MEGRNLDLQADFVTFQESVKTAESDQLMDLLGPEFHVIHQTNRAADEREFQLRVADQ